MVRRFFFLLFLVALPHTVSGATLRVGMSVDYPPLTYKQEGRVVGLEVDNARAVAELLGMQLELVELPFTGLIPALEQGRIDVIMSGLSKTPERAERIVFVEPYLDIGQMGITLVDKAGAFLQPWSIYREGLRVGVEPGTTGAEF
ncbi:MAG: amino acid ABC transporter substrate-binding protein, partial [Halioglobus sp.]|nr:amino acid ABC transporter substrate-binding protein [Halioglobus sp.]